jgi:WD40 repeat protein
MRSISRARFPVSAIDPMSHGCFTLHGDPMTNITTATSDSRRLWRAQAPLAGHLSPITAIACQEATGTTFTGGYDGHVLRWTADLTQVEWQLRFGDLVNSIAIDPTGTRLAVATADGYVYVVACADGSELTRLGPHGDDVNDISWNPCSPTSLAVVCDAGDCDVTIWNLETQLASAERLCGHRHGVFAVVHDPSGDQLATASEDGTVRIWRDGGLAATLEHPGDVETVDWSRDGRMLATGCDDGALRLWSATAGILTASLIDADAAVRKVCFSPAGTTVMAASYDGTVRIYDLATLQMACEITGPLQWERAAAFDGETSVVIGSFGCRPVRHRLHSPGSMQRNGAQGRRHAAISAGTRTWGINALASVELDSTYAATDSGIVLNLDTGNPVFETDTLICDLAASRDSELPLAVSDYLGRVTLLASEGGHRQIGCCDGGPANAVASLCDGTIATGGYDGRIRRWSLSGELIASFKAHAGPIKSLTWSHGAQMLVAGSSDDTASAWTLDGEAQEAARLSREDLVLVNSVDAIADSSWVAVASRDGHLRLWNVCDESLQTMPGVHAKSIKTVAADRSQGRGIVVVTGSYDGSICIWHLEDPPCCRSYVQLFFHGKPGVSSVLIEGDVITSAGWDGVVAKWDIQGRMLNTLDAEVAYRSARAAT